MKEQNHFRLQILEFRFRVNKYGIVFFLELLKSTENLNSEINFPFQPI